MMKYMKLISTVTLALLFVTACGTAENTVPNEGTDSRNRGTEQVDEKKKSLIEEDAINVELVPKENADLVYIYRLTNMTNQPIELSFASLQEFDFILWAQDGAKKFQFSDDRAFGEAFVEKEIPANGNIEWEIDLYEWIPTLESGDYTIEVWSKALESDGFKIKAGLTKNN